MTAKVKMVSVRLPAAFLGPLVSPPVRHLVRLVWNLWRIINSLRIMELGETSEVTKWANPLLNTTELFKTFEGSEFLFFFCHVPLNWQKGNGEPTETGVGFLISKLYELIPAETKETSSWYFTSYHFHHHDQTIKAQQSVNFVFNSPEKRGKYDFS